MVPAALRYTILLLVLFSTCLTATAQPPEPIPTTKAAWIDKLAGLSLQNGTGYQTLQQFIRLDPGLVAAIVTEGWPRFKDSNVRNSIIGQIIRGPGYFNINGVEVSDYKPNPHLLDLMALVLKSASPPTKDDPFSRQSWETLQVRQELLGIAFRDLSTPTELADWRKPLGERPLTDIIRDSARDIVHQLDSGTNEQRLKALGMLREISFYDSTGTSSINGVVTHLHSASGGLMKLRRDALLAANLPGALAKLLRPDLPEAVRRLSVRVLAQFRPEDDILTKIEPDIKRELPPLLESPPEPRDVRNPFRQPSNLADLLTAFSSDWAADLFARLMLKNADSPNPDYTVTNAIQNFGSPRIIPTLIALVGHADTTRFGTNIYENALRQIAQVGWNGNVADRTHDEMWWRLWWHDNKKRYSQDVQNLAIPALPKNMKNASGTNLASVGSARHVERALISEDPNRAYWLISPGFAPKVVLTEAEKAAVVSADLKKLAAVKQDRPGLVVLVLDGDTSGTEMMDTGIDICDALNKRYYVAVAIRPHWSESGNDRWLTRKDNPLSGSRLSTETFVEQIVRQMTFNYGIDETRIFLIANGKAGTAAYACALQKETAIRGFGILSTAFRSALLPSLDYAKSRRFYVGLGMQGSGASDALAAAAEPILRQHGAIVQIDTVKSGALLDAIQDAVRWLDR